MPKRSIEEARLEADFDLGAALRLEIRIADRL